MACQDLKDDAIEDFDNQEDFSPSVDSISTQESTTATSALIAVVRGKVQADLRFLGFRNVTGLPANGDGILYLKVTPQTDGSSNNPLAEPASPAVFHQAFSAPVGGDQVTKTEILNNNADPDFTITVCGPGTTIKGWTLTDQAVIVTREPKNLASFSIQGGPGFPPLIAPSESFYPQTKATISSETEIQWGNVKLTSSGGADRSLYPQPTALGNPVNYTPSPNITFSAAAPGFDKKRHLGGYYRPVILLIFSPVFTIKTGTPTTLTAKFYVNGTLVRTDSIAVSGASKVRYYAFSIQGVGVFGNVKPPDNNSGDDFNGWPPPPTVKFSLTPNSGSIELATSTSATNYVLNYAPA